MDANESPNLKLVIIIDIDHGYASILMPLTFKDHPVTEIIKYIHK